jgi:hypothetical protein
VSFGTNSKLTERVNKNESSTQNTVNTVDDRKQGIVLTAVAMDCSGGRWCLDAAIILLFLLWSHVVVMA